MTAFEWKTFFVWRVTYICVHVTQAQFLPTSSKHVSPGMRFLGLGIGGLSHQSCMSLHIGTNNIVGGSTILFRSCWVPFWSPTFSVCRRSFCLPNWPNLSFYSDLVGSRFELRAHPYWFLPRVPPPPPPPRDCFNPHFFPCSVSIQRAVLSILIRNLTEYPPPPPPHTPGARSSTAMCWIVWVECKKGMALT